MTNSQVPRRDPLIDDVRETRERLVREHGGLVGWVRYLQELEKEHPERVVDRSALAGKHDGR
jgi:hypothetical protein